MFCRLSSPHLSFIFLILMLALFISSSPVVATVYGTSGFIFSGSLPPNIIEARYEFRVLKNESPTIKIIFGWNRFYAPGNNNTHNIETNVYSDRIIYNNPACATWPMLGIIKPGESSIRIAAPDNLGLYVPSLAGRFGVKTSDPILMPLQTYLVDNIPNLPKTDAVTQSNINGQWGRITIYRGDIASNLVNWKSCGETLPQEIYRQWLVRLELENQPTTTTTFIFPDAEARYLAPWEFLTFGSEFLHTNGSFTVRFWNMAYKTETSSVWIPMTTFITNANYDGTGIDFGVRVVNNENRDEVEMSNVPGEVFLAANSVFHLTASPRAYYVTAIAGTGGNISPPSQTVNSGSTTNFTVTANVGFSIQAVTGCEGALSGNTYTTGQIFSNCTVTATFSASGSNNDIVPLQASSPNVIGAGLGDDIYILDSSLLTSARTFTLSDTQGSNNVIQLAAGLKIASSAMTIDVYGADGFSYAACGNATEGLNPTPVSFTTFATATLGIVSVPTDAATVVNGGAVTITCP